MQRILTLLLVLSWLGLSAQSVDLTYYLPDIDYDPEIPTPESFLGYQIGSWHISHDQQLMYMRHLAELSPRMSLRQHARTYEGRPLVHIIVTSEANQARLDEIQAEHVALSDPEQSGRLDTEDMPTVIYQGFSIHGNEPSGANAAPLVAYYLAAARGAEIEALLDDLVIIFDPSFNPDGLTRFSTWANMHKNENLTSDSNDREYDEAWPGGRTNHYWFDINRDWLPVQHPESRGRIQTFHDWKPNILTDHHEMGSNSTFFFMPGEPTRVHPLTPKMNQELTGKIADYHAEALDEIGSLYYSGEGYDDFYYGKGSTYPDANGCIGILFEQASSRGHLQETDNGLLSFPYTIRNQVTTALSTQRAAVGLRQDLLNFQRDFYRQSMDDARGDRVKSYVFGDANDASRTQHLLEILRRHRIDVYKLDGDLSLDGKPFAAESSYVVPVEQTQYRLIKAMFETRTSFEDSLFYDVSAWTLPMAFNIPYAETGRRDIQGEQVTGLMDANEPAVPQQSNYAYLVDWDDYYAPKAVYRLLKAGLRAKVASRPLELEGERYPEGTVMVPARNQDMSGDEIYELIRSVSQSTGVEITAVATGYSPVGPDLGSNDFEPLELPKVLLAVGEGVSSYDAGEVWHLFDQRYGMVTSKVDISSLSRVDIWQYNVIVLPNGSYSRINSVASTIKRWLQDGGTLITMDRSAQWAAQNDLASLKVRKPTDEKDDDKTRRPYAKANRDRGGKVIGGAIFAIEADLTHPVFYGYHQEEIPVFKRGTIFFEPSNNVYATPAIYRDKPLLSGYLNKIYEGKIDGSAAVVVSGVGRGRTISMTFNPNFRAFWYGTNRIFLNSVFFGSTISGGTVETED
ncbi:M14 family metallopeptidase [Flavilitoribacter nigricans]|uniref:Zinc carboxypeptidase n=1 Tax=Flavilitoribacter nigricans (strain ATCC 23147 / DSM 23189 / NBRC 102662 / NCIMB 1420 / SS-2) TaxID=1122177 RepID=A0A2D0N4I9_FLAN2|nr:M14 family metallopeptidase [Flavilitoribacter nigricans]PHN03357.1 zinc carboxypeptidase [Flavilitoribacter nigricans DSM 23189 = NBRC 102662]